jgi:retinol-binding protein 3
MDNKQDFISRDTQLEIIHQLSAKLKTCYVFPDVAEQINEHIQQSLRDGEYDEFTEGNLFALALTMHLQEVNHDEHLWVRWHQAPLPENEMELRHNPEWQDAKRKEAELENFGFASLEKLPGNVGYLDIHYFHRPAWGGATAVSAMSFLAYASAVIIDLRECTGGYPGMVALVCSYLFGDEPVHLDSIYWRDEDIIQQYWTQPYVPGARFPNTPVFLLTSKETFSAGEELAYILKHRKRATLIGEQTDGGAHPGASFRIHPHFEAFIPIGRTINPITKTNWEGCGVTPDILIPRAQSYNTAYRLALQSNLTNLKDSTSDTSRRLAEEAQTALNSLEDS